MTVFLNENFDSTTAGSLPSGWSSSGVTAAVSTSRSLSGTKSLKLSSSGAYGFAWKAAAVDSGVGLIQAEMTFQIEQAPASSYLDPNISIYCTAPASGSTFPDAVTFILGVYSADGGARLDYHHDSGSTFGMFSGFATGGLTWDAAEWYRMLLVVYPKQEFTNQFIYFGGYLQRVSDSKWLWPDGTWQPTQAPVAVSYTILKTLSWLGGTFATFGTYTTTGNALYIDNVRFETSQSWEGFTTVPASPPAPVADVEFTGTYTAGDAGQGGHILANLNTDLTAYYGSTALYAAWVMLDLGSGKASKVTRVLYAPGTGEAFVEGGDGMSWYLLGAQIEGANSTSGPWTQLGQTDGQEYPPRFNWTTQALDPNTPGGTYRYLRLRTPLTYCALAGLRFFGLNQGGVTWAPSRPDLSPAAGRFGAGQTVAMTSLTSGASIYYTHGYEALDGAWAATHTYTTFMLVSNGGNVYRCITAGTSAGSGGPTGTGSNITDGTAHWEYLGVLSTTPTTGSTLYTAPVALDSVVAAEQVIRAIAYHASGTTTTSDVVTGRYCCPQKVVPDTGRSPGYPGTSGTYWPSDWYDTDGVLIQANTGGCQYDAQRGAYYLTGSSFNQPKEGGDVRAHGFRVYKSTDLFNWERVGFVPNVPFHWYNVDNSKWWYSQTRPHMVVNASPIDPNKRIVLFCHLDTIPGYTNGAMGVATAPDFEGPWTWQHSMLPSSAPTTSEVDTFLEDDGSWWLIYVADQWGGGHRHEAGLLDVTTDNTTFPASPTFITLNTDPYEGLAFFKRNGHYVHLAGAAASYGDGTLGQLYYHTATTMAGLASASWAVLWASAPASTTVAYNAQITCVVPLSTGHYTDARILMTDIVDAHESPVDLYHCRMAWWPVIGSSFPTDATLAIAAPVSWDFSAFTVQALLTDADSELSGGFSSGGM